MSLCSGEHILAILRHIQSHRIAVSRDACEHLHLLCIHHIECAGVVAGSKDIFAGRRQLDGAGTSSHLAVLPPRHRHTLVLHLRNGIQNCLQRNLLHITSRVDAQIQIAVLQHQVAHIRHHALQTSQILRLLQVNHSDAAATTHAAHQQVVVVGSEHRAAQRITASRITVHGTGEAIVQFQLIIHDVARLVFPLLRIVAADVDDAHRVVSPMRNGHILAVRRGGNHLRQWSCLHQSDNLVRLCVDDGNCRRILCVNVIRTTVVGHPQIPSAMRESALHRLAVECVQVVVLIMRERIKSRRLAPQVGILRMVKLMLDDSQLLESLEVIHHSGGTLQRVHVELLAVRMYIHRLGRIDVRVSRGFIARGVKLLFADEFDTDAAISRLCRLANLGTHQLSVHQQG